MSRLTTSVVFGVVVFQLVTGYSPDNHDEDYELLSRIVGTVSKKTDVSKPNQKYRKDSFDKQSMKTRAVYQEAQRQRILAADRPGKDEVFLARHNETLEVPVRWSVDSDEIFYHNAYGYIEGCTPTHSSLRQIRDLFATEQECKELFAATEDAMKNLFHRGGTTSLAPCHKKSQQRLGMKGGLLFEYLLDKTRLQIMRDYNLSGLYLSGALLTRLVADPPADKWEVDPQHVYWNPHVDKANIATYDYSALLYLNHHGSDFDGGELVFLDDDADRIVQPRPGRLVTFASGPENLHRVRRVGRGRRGVLAMWFTCSPDHQYRDEDEDAERKPSAGVEEQVAGLREVNEELAAANEVLLQASGRLREENRHLRTLAKACLAAGALEGRASGGGEGRDGAGGAGRRGGGVCSELSSAFVPI